MGVGIVTDSIPSWPLCNYSIATAKNPVLLISVNYAKG